MSLSATRRRRRISQSEILLLEEGECDGKKRLHTSMTAEASLICLMYQAALENLDQERHRPLRIYGKLIGLRLR